MKNHTRTGKGKQRKGPRAFLPTLAPAPAQPPPAPDVRGRIDLLALGIADRLIVRTPPAVQAVYSMVRGLAGDRLERALAPWNRKTRRVLLAAVARREAWEERNGRGPDPGGMAR